MWVLFIQGKMLDLIFAVDDPIHWHAENLKKNWDHYSALRHFGSKAIGYIQSCTAGIYYNPMVKMDDQVSPLYRSRFRTAVMIIVNAHPGVISAHAARVYA